MQRSDSTCLLVNDRRTTIRETPRDLAPFEDKRDESLRQAQFLYSAEVMAGQKCDFRYILKQHN